MSGLCSATARSTISDLYLFVVAEKKYCSTTVIMAGNNVDVTERVIIDHTDIKQAYEKVKSLPDDEVEKWFINCCGRFPVIPLLKSWYDLRTLFFPSSV